MATKRMLIDASHPEETRVVVLDGTKLEGYDVEVASRRQLKGNIYLAKVTRVEPSLQAAFVDYGGNRHGFLAFNEIHPDYYQIPVADRQALLAEHEQAANDADGAAAAEETVEEAETVEVVGGDDEEELERRPPRPPTRNYKIQEVIKRRQILLVQVVKEERGNKGAALTTYLSLAGRYCVLMPNTSRGGGISRKIGGLTDRKRLKKILAELEVPGGMGVIVRTAGAGRTKAEIKRDYEYLMRLWVNIRETTLSSIAPALVYEEASLIKRSIRDLYGRDTEEIVIQGEPEYRIAKEFMKLFIPSHAKRVKLHDDTQRPLFNLHQVESQLDAMHLPTVPLRSGGYIVINPTEALVSIDVNSGRATRERHIEETALRTNLEAADEIARQLRLRDLAGLIVIDFIDMENSRNQGQVERRIKDAMKTDRARIQVGRISPFGLLELSRQRLRPSLLETSFETCPYCAGMGVCRTTESTVLSILRKIEEEGLKAKGGSITVTASPVVAMYLLNQKRKSLAELEARFQFSLVIAADPTFAPAQHRLDRIKGPVVAVEEAADAAEEAVTEPDEEEQGAEEPASAGEGAETGKRARRRRPRRRRRSDEDTRPVPAVADADGGGGQEPGTAVADGAVETELGLAEDDEGLEAERDEETEAQGDASNDQDAARKRRRRGKRGGRRRPRRLEEESSSEAAADGGEVEAAGASAAPEHEGDPVHRDRLRRPAVAAPVTPSDEPAADENAPQNAWALAAGGDEIDRLDAPPADAGSLAYRTEDPAAPLADDIEAGDTAFEIVSYPPGAAVSQLSEARPVGIADPYAAAVEMDVGEREPTVSEVATAEPAGMAAAETGDGDAACGTAEPEADKEKVEAAAAVDYAAAPAEPAPGDEDGAAAARTEVIHVGGGGETQGPTRKGWWQRLMS